MLFYFVSIALGSLQTDGFFLYLAVDSLCLNAGADVHHKVIVVGNTDGGDVEFIVLYRDVLHRIFERQHRFGIEFSFLLHLADAEVLNLAGEDEAVADEDGILTQLDVADKRGNKKIQCENVGCQHYQKGGPRSKGYDRANGKKNHRRNPDDVEKPIKLWLINFILHCLASVS